MQPPEKSTKFRIKFSSSAEGTYIEVDLQLNHRGTDFNVYANTGYTAHTGDAAHLQVITRALVAEDSGVRSLVVSPMVLEVIHVSFVTVAEIRERVMNALREAGFEPVDVDEEERRLLDEVDNAMAELQQKPRFSWREASRYRAG